MRTPAKPCSKKGAGKMTTNSSCGELEITPLTAAATGLTLYYDDYDNCYTSSTGATQVGAVQVNTDESAVVITFTPRPGVSALPLSLYDYCGDDNSRTNASVASTGGTHVLTLTMPSTEDLEWGWDFGPTPEQQQQQQQQSTKDGEDERGRLFQAIKIKVRVIRI